MASDLFADDLPRPQPGSYELGQDITRLSQFELEESIVALQREITRLQEALEQKKRSQAAADSIFKR